MTDFTRALGRTALLLLAAAHLGAAPTRVAAQLPDAVEIIFLDVGQADAVLIRAPDGQVALVDAGRSAPVGQLRELGVESIDLLVATHPHADHIGGMQGVLAALPVRFYMDNGQPHTTETYLSLMRTLRARADIGYLAAQPRTVSLGSVRLEVLPLPPLEATDHNNRSVGLVVRYGAFAAFLSGDSEREELTWFLNAGVVPDVTVLKAPHHGSDNGFTPNFLETAQPELVVISVGPNAYGHPRPEALAAYAATTDAVYRTDFHGQVTVRGWEDGSFEVWTDATAPVARPGGPAQPLAPPAPPAGPASSSAGALTLRVFADAPGNDHQNTNGEYVVIENRMDDALAIAGWTLCDAARHCFRFPAGAVVAGGGRITLFTGRGVANGTRFFMNSGRAVWNNDGDVATLLDARGNVVARCVYD